MKKYLVLCTAVVLAACSGSSQKFSESDLHSGAYKSYWAMQPVNDIYRVIQFHRNGNVKIYDYRCELDGSYRLTETENVYLSKISPNVFTLLDGKRKAFAQYRITKLNATSLQATQTFLDKTILPRTLNLSYYNVIGAKPHCGF